MRKKRNEKGREIIKKGSKRHVKERGVRNKKVEMQMRRKKETQEKERNEKESRMR